MGMMVSEQWSKSVPYSVTKEYRSILLGGLCINPFTPKSDQLQISPAASSEILRHTVWRTWLFIAYSDERWLYYQFSLHHLYLFYLKGWESVRFELGSERVNHCLDIYWLQTNIHHKAFLMDISWIFSGVMGFFFKEWFSPCDLVKGNWHW